jgi:hypothetical protein
VTGKARSAASKRASCAPSSCAARRRSAVISKPAPIAATPASPTTAAATDTARSARGQLARPGSTRGRRISCPPPTSMSCSPCRPRSGGRLSEQGHRLRHPVRSRDLDLEDHRRRSAASGWRDRWDRPSCTAGGRRSRTIPISVASFPAAHWRQTAAGSPAGPTSSCLSMSSCVCSADGSPSGLSRRMIGRTFFLWRSHRAEQARGLRRHDGRATAD